MAYNYIGTAPDPTGNPDPNGAFAGGIDEVALYNRALSATEVQLHYKSDTSSATAFPRFKTWSTAVGSGG